ncbi:MAG: FixH family protein [Betaproteobacteria bacterium]|nr:MAG: FixH family protein [Betaproteobacteria bacterium]
MRFLLLICVFLTTSAAAQRVDANLDCKYTGKDFIYDCVIRLSRGGEPLSGAQLSVGADMPSMPMAHSIKPVKARSGKKPGEYAARLDLEMPGEWTVKLRLAGPVRDLLIVHYNFTESGTAPRK